MMRFSDTSRTGLPFAKDPSVIRFGNRYLLYFSLPAHKAELAPLDENKGWSIGIAESQNLIDWTKIGEILPEQACERNGICAPGAYVEGGQVHLFYQTYGNGPKDAICHATSRDGVVFVRDATNPVFRPTGDWNVGRAIDAEAFAFDGHLLLYFATRDPQMKTQMLGVARAPLGSDYSQDTWTQMCDAPILAPTLAWEQDCIEAATVCQRDGKLFMFYAGAYNNAPQQIGVATSVDGIVWKRVSELPFLPNGPEGSWNSSESGHPGVFVEGDRTFLFYQGNDTKGKTWYLSQIEITKTMWAEIENQR
jgi:beta-1,2-mannobiose phosphorylase / 1,2-beta-oligomannan phosphorylase